MTTQLTIIELALGFAPVVALLVALGFRNRSSSKTERHSSFLGTPDEVNRDMNRLIGEAKTSLPVNKSFKKFTVTNEREK